MKKKNHTKSNVNPNYFDFEVFYEQITKPVIKVEAKEFDNRTGMSIVAYYQKIKS